MKRSLMGMIYLLFIIGFTSCSTLASDEEPENKNPFSVVGNWFADRGKDIGDAATAAGEGIANVAVAAGEGITDAATVVGEGITTAATAAGEGITNAVTAAGEGITNAATVAGEGITNSAGATGDWFVGRATDVQNVALATADWTVKAVQNFDPSVFSDPEYYSKSVEKVVLGDYSEQDPTALSVGINIAASIANVDVAMDIRDLSYDIQHLKSGDVSPATLALDTVALIPVIGAVKYLKHVDTVVDAAKAAETVVDAAKAAETVVDAAKAAETVVDVASDVGKTIDTVADVSDAAHDVSKVADAIDDVHDAAKAADMVDDVHDAVNVADTLDDAHDAAKGVETVDDVHDLAKTTDIVADVADEAGDIAKRGGSYAEVFNPGEGALFEVHHMPADKTTGLKFEEGPVIKMDKADHYKTASRGSSTEAILYRQRQKELVDQGHFREALQMDIDDIHSKFGDKYDEAIEEMLKYVDKLIQEGKIIG